MTKEKKILIARILIPILVALISIFGIGRIATNTDTYAKTIESLDKKKTTVLELTAAATAASAAITLIPDDTGTPIAEKLADLSTYFLWVIGAIFLEKYLLVIIGYASFYLIIPAACVGILANIYFKSNSIRRLIIKFFVLAISISLVIPTSVLVSNMIEDTYRESIDNTINTATDTTKKIEESSKEDSGALSNIINSITSGVSFAINSVKQVLSMFVEALAVMLVTTCVIPIVVLLFFIWLIKIILGINIDVPMIGKKHGPTKLIEDAAK